MNDFEQGLLRHLSRQQLKTIQAVHIGIGGCGGLGSNTAVLLTRCGFQHFTIMDFDRVSASNLNRQQFTLKDIGQPKTGCLANKMRAVNPDVSCRPFDARWQKNMANDPFLSCDVIVEAFDQAEVKTAFVEYYHSRTRWVVCGNGLAGITGPELSVHRKKNIFFAGDGSTAADQNHPPMAPRVTACAAMIAEVVLALTLNMKPFYDSRTPKES